MDPDLFALELWEFMTSMGIGGLPNSGLRFPPAGWDWDDCCHACVWLAFTGYELPGAFVNRMMLGPHNMSVWLYCKWVLHKSGGRRVADIFDLAS